MKAPFTTIAECRKITERYDRFTVSEVVLATGVWDVIHRGHIELLEQAATYGPVFVGLNTDEAVRQLKGPMRPINTLEDRAYVLTALRSVRAVFPIDAVTVEEAIRYLRPSHWVKSSQYTLETLNQDEVRAAKDVGAEIVLVSHVSGHSTTGVLSRL